VTELWRRIWSLQVGEILLESTPDSRDSLQVSFSVNKTLGREPNTAEISIMNLGRETRSRIVRQGGEAPVILSVGYGGTGLDTIFSGDLEHTPSVWEGPNVTLNLEGRDGGRSYSNARISRTFRAGTPVFSVLSAAVDALQVGRGNLDDFRGSLSLSGGATSYPGPMVLHGLARDEVNRIVRSVGATWSIQNGVFMLRVRALSNRRALSLSPETGLIESPSVQKEGRVTVTNAKCLIIPGLYPGRIVTLSSREFVGDQGYEIKAVTYVGQTRGNDWYAALELRDF